jgi:hypothetical protein
MFHPRNEKDPEESKFKHRCDQKWKEKICHENAKKKIPNKTSAKHIQPSRQNKWMRFRPNGWIARERGQSPFCDSGLIIFAGYRT